jgi:hypothetical protein
MGFMKVCQFSRGRDVALGGLVVACLPLDPRFMGSNPTKDDGFLSAIRIYSTGSFRGEIKPYVPCRKILRQLRNLTRYERDTS